MVVSVERFKKVTKMSAKLRTVGVSIARSLSASQSNVLVFPLLQPQILAFSGSQMAT